MTPRTTAAVVAMPLLGLLVVLIAFLPVGFVVFSPGITVDVLGDYEGGEVVQVVDGPQTYPDEGGQLRMTTVLVSQPDTPVNLFEAGYAWLHPEYSVFRKEAIYPEGQTTEQRREESAVQMVSSQDAAVAQVLTELGYDVEPVVEVLAVSPGMPADGVFRVRDVITHVAGDPVTNPQQVVDVVVAAAKGEPLEFRVLRDGKPETLEVTPEQVDGKNRVGVTTGPGYEFPFQVKFNIDPAIGGPSAGLMFALALQDTLTPGSLTGDRIVAGTGTLDAEGKVGPIGGIQQKVYGARDAGAEMFLVPADNCRDLGDVLDIEGITLVKATTFDDALASVEAWADDPSTSLPTCEAS